MDTVALVDAGEVDEFILRRLELRTEARPLDLAVQHHLLAGPEDLREEALVEEDGARRAGGIAYRHLEDREAGTTRGLDLSVDDFACDRGRARSQRGDGDDVPTIFIAEREPEQQVLERAQPRRRQRGGASRPDAGQIAERGLERIGRGHCSTVTWPGSTRISRIDEGRSKGASRSMPLGSSGDTL